MSRRIISRLRTFGSRRPAVAAVVSALLVILVAGVFLWFRPDKLFVDDVVDEAFPDPAPSATAPDDAAAVDADDAGEEPEDATSTDEEAGPVLVAAGPFTSHNRYTTAGDALVYRFEEGRSVLRFEGFETSNGPDLRVYLSAAEPGTEDRSLADDFIDLGRLRGNIGAQNYEIPVDIDLDRYRTVVIWCQRFTVSFGGAELAAPPA